MQSPVKDTPIVAEMGPAVQLGADAVSNPSQDGPGGRIGSAARRGSPDSGPTTAAVRRRLDLGTAYPAHQHSPTDCLGLEEISADGLKLWVLLAVVAQTTDERIFTVELCLRQQQKGVYSVLQRLGC